ncbi:MAG: hypothetical protein A3F84_22150 [Candidatus Handelsmanbacteria bacterium RIFCSPLOWO2_12_FULL_64_10]|uniref:NADP-dependent oxidoreductase domain-containing protein n=1 Tax=Handelsmanbacteria sp. (strain RIFCSPLOWO2_12_FULL_64_10) TaxID=1817868 RepID=A0A1F6D4N6_HANXR|nr:MAG: hypothetical protein A3F84_22150 [Candidatus Handelsmanbacteria bacterium RIFCSPLOWO2_12_FULL_64_10]
MQMRRLGRTGLQVSAIGCGGIPIFRAEKPEAVKVLRRAMDLGVNYFDTARGYAKGGSEERLAEAIQGRRSEVVIASKSTARTRDEMMKAVEESLRTLGVETIDVYKCHHVITPEEWGKVSGPGGALEALKEAREQGKVRFVGVSGHRPEVLAEAVRSGEIDVLLVPFNFVKDEAATDLFPHTQAHDVGVTIMKPLGGSLFQHADICLRWILQHEAVSTICVGMWKAWEVDQNVAVGRYPEPLNPEELDWLADERARWDREYCRLCYKCEPKCREGVPARDLMILNLNYRRFGLKMMMEQGMDKKIEALTACSLCDHHECVGYCAYHLPIPALMQQLRRTYTPIIRAYQARQSAPTA